jgi:BirA family biotin operon repressor/biotin-[acetyl-CoA-carboxylase] ligase
MKGELIDADLVARQVARHDLDWRYSRETGSTNADVLDHYAEFRREVVAFSETQNAGRGRRGRQWHSPYASNIYCTVGMLKALPANRQGLLSIVTGLALCRALRQSADASVSLKWPNDLLFGGRKLGGILIESRPHDDEQLFFFAIGFGLNVFMQASELAEIAQPAASLDQAAGRPLDRTELLTAAIDGVVRAVRAFDPDDVEPVIAEFEACDAFYGQEVELTSAGASVRGINRGIAGDGQLRLETETGESLHSSAEISLRPGL